MNPPALKLPRLISSQDVHWDSSKRFGISHRVLADRLGYTARYMTQVMDRHGYAYWEHEERTSERQGRYTTHRMMTVLNAVCLLRSLKHLSARTFDAVQAELTEAFRVAAAYHRPTLRPGLVALPGAKLSEPFGMTLHEVKLKPGTVINGAVSTRGHEYGSKGTDWGFGQPVIFGVDHAPKRDYTAVETFTLDVEPGQQDAMYAELEKLSPKLTLAPTHSVDILEARLELQTKTIERLTVHRDDLQTRHNKLHDDLKAARARIAILEKPELHVDRPKPIPGFHTTGRWAKKQWLSYQNTPVESDYFGRGAHADRLLRELDLIDTAGNPNERGKLYSKTQGIYTVWEQGLGAIVKGLDVA